MLVYFLSLGCDKNFVDSERMLAYLRDAGYSFTDDEQAADIIVVNTCCFIHDAKTESIEEIIRLGKYKKSGHLQALIVAGCLGERYQDEIFDALPEIDALVGVNELDAIAQAIEGAIADKSKLPSIDKTASPVKNNRCVTTGGHYAYLKIAEGCDKRCTYCIIPAIRGRYASVPLEELIAEAESLAAGGVKELIIVAQETTLYGVDLYGEKSLAKLLKRLCGIEGLRWIRLLYCYPEEITDELIALIRDEEKILPYLDIPIQHGADAILRRMGRKTDRASIMKLVAKLRHAIPDICLRTTLITGFPGETRALHLENLSLIEEAAFDRLGVFCYSQEEGTKAALLEGQVGERTKRQRYAELMERQQRLSKALSEKMVGKRLDVMVEGLVDASYISEDLSLSEMNPDNDAHSKVYATRTYRDAPDIDGYLFLCTDQELLSGEFVSVLVTAAHQYDLIGRNV